MSEDNKNLIKNAIIIFIISFVFFSALILKQEFDYYKVYSELPEGFSMFNTLLHCFTISFMWSSIFMIISIPFLVLLKKLKRKNWIKILLSIILAIIVIWVILYIKYIVLDYPLL